MERECVRKAKLRESKSGGECLLAGVSVCVCTSGIDRVDPHVLNMGSVTVLKCRHVYLHTHTNSLSLFLPLRSLVVSHNHTHVGNTADVGHAATSAPRTQGEGGTPGLGGAKIARGGGQNIERPRLLIKSLMHPTDPNWCPVTAVVNGKLEPNGRGEQSRPEGV